MRANTQQVCCQDGWWHKWIWCSLASGATAQSAMVHNVPSPNYLVEFGKTVQSLHSPNRVPCRL